MIIIQRLIRPLILSLALLLAGFSSFAFADDVHLTKAEIKTLHDKVKNCWVLPPELMKDKTLNVAVKFDLDKSGTVVGDIETIVSGGTPESQLTMATSAQRAIRKCQPYKLPVEKYQSWSTIEFHFATDAL